MHFQDYIDAFEKLLRLGLKNQQERELIHVITDCCLQEKSYNQFYSYLLQKFCEYDRRFLVSRINLMIKDHCLKESYKMNIIHIVYKPLCDSDRLLQLREVMYVIKDLHQ